MTGSAGEAQEGDEAIVARVLAGDRNAYVGLVVRHQDLLYRHALRMTGEADAAADLVQVAFVKAYTQLARCREPHRFGAWAFRILANQAKDWLKSRARQEISLDAAAPSAVSDDDPTADLDRSELRAVLATALAQLPPGLREALVLKHVEGLSYEEMSELMNVSVPALKMRVHRARQMLQDALEEVR